MNFEATLRLLLQDFKEKNVQYGLIGGFAMGLLGITRSTIDIDFLIDADDASKIDGIMKARGYSCVHQSEDVSQYVSTVKIFGEVDFLHARREIARRMLKESIETEVFEGQLKIRILKPEDIIGLKVQASMNDSVRLQQDFSDIESLMKYYGKKLDWNRLQEYFSLFGQNQKFTELKSLYAQV